MGTWQHHGERDARYRINPQVIGCTVLGCGCEGFQPEKVNLRSCGQCHHGWVVHGKNRLSLQHFKVEAVRASQVYDLSSLLLFGAQAVPTRMKILLDRLYSVLPPADVRNILHSLGWTLRDYVRGYILQDSLGRVLDRWVMMSHDEEVATLQQFLRFGETRPIVELMGHQAHDLNIVTATRPNSDIRYFIECSGQSRSAVSPLGGAGNSLHQFENLQGACVSLLSPVPFGTHTLTHTPALTHTQGHARLNSLSEQTPKINSPIRDSCGKGGSFDVDRESRVSCSACAKTFYDKGTLKIHYNAVHLKIKHGCTVPGCSALFSSLRSRNRHSANPNPRLHSHWKVVRAKRMGNQPIPEQHFQCESPPARGHGESPALQ
ncbi:zinc finger protein basonuclin-2 [Alosa sapidissima]|uniref:zinc finger protein basonuclin-2 n=1 Tax=Alosa sapidissima TaxID=34773 RepID=UPI001C0976DB|nr:zinc finger protein basonuclin-2 [Alosa sapidissima]